jgi:hypothetical protein
MRGIQANDELQTDGELDGKDGFSLENTRRGSQAHKVIFSWWAE